MVLDSPDNSFRFIATNEVMESPGVTSVPSPTDPDSERMLTVPFDRYGLYEPYSRLPGAAPRARSDSLTPEASEQPTSVLAGTWALTNTITGAGIMALPYAFNVLGFVGGTVGLVAAAILTYISIHVLVRSSAIMGEPGYNSLTTTVFGPKAERAVRCCIIINNLGLLVAYLDIIADCLAGHESDEGVVRYWSRRGRWGLSEALVSRPAVLALMLLVVILPVSIRKSTKLTSDMQWTSLLALVFAANLVVTTVVLAIYLASSGRTAYTRLFPALHTPFRDIVATIPILFTAFICQFNVHPIMSQMAEPQNASILRVARNSLIITCILYAATGSAACVIFGSAVQADILDMNMAAGLAAKGVAHAAELVSVMKVGYALALCFSFPIISLALRENVMEMVPQSARVERTTLNMAMGVVLLGLEYVLSIAVPSINTVFQLLGSSVGIIIAFTMPALISMRLDCTRSFVNLMVSSGLFWITTIVGIFCFIIACTEVAKEGANGPSSVSPAPPPMVPHMS